jgi:glycosyltransferase involved in cell wall biosynthesis
MMNITILATRIAGNDGVSLETEHWRRILTKLGHKVTFVAGQLDREGVILPELHFQHYKTAKLYNEVVYSKNHYERIEAEIFAQAGVIEGKLRDLFRALKTDLLIVPNVLSLPMHFPLAVALSRIIEEKKINTILRHHDFWWERERFNNSTLFQFFMRFFPPLGPNIKHVVINSIAQKEFEKRTGTTAAIIHDTADFKHAKLALDSFSKSFRGNFGLKDDDIVFLQATRIVPRKRIELSIELVEKLNNPKAILLIAGVSGDEGQDYKKRLMEIVHKSHSRVKFIGKYVNTKRKIAGDRRVYTLWDAYRNADFVTYPTVQEGYGNQLVEAILFKKPIVMTPYSVYKEDIKPLGFETVEMPDKVTAEVVSRVTELISDKSNVEAMVNRNFELGQKYMSYEATSEKIKKLL